MVQSEDEAGTVAVDGDGGGKKILRNEPNFWRRSAENARKTKPKRTHFGTKSKPIGASPSCHARGKVAFRLQPQPSIKARLSGADFP
jgi:hypothetical protein